MTTGSAVETTPIPGLLVVRLRDHEDARGVGRLTFAGDLSGRPVTCSTREGRTAGTTSATVAPRPANSLLDLEKIRATGFEPEDALTGLERYCAAVAPTGSRAQ